MTAQAPHAFIDPAFAAMAAEAQAGRTSPVTLDLFSDLVGTHHAAPPSLARALRGRHLIPDHLSDQVFAEIRRYCGTIAARRLGRDAGLEDAYALFPPPLDADAATLADAERAWWTERCFPHPEAACLLRHLAAAGVPVVIEVSRDHPAAPAAAANGFLLALGLPDLPVRLTDARRSGSGSEPAGDALGWLRRRLRGADHATALNGADRAAVLRGYGASKAGPALTAFTAWVLERTAALGARRVFFSMRDGEMPYQIARIISGGSVEPRRIWLSRALCLRGALLDGTDEPLVNLLVRSRTRPLTVQAALDGLGVAPPDRTCPLPPDHLVGEADCAVLCDWMSASGRLDHALQAAAAIRRDIIAHLGAVGALDGGGPLVVADLGYAGNIQRALQVILRAEGVAVPLCGLFLVATPGVLWAQREGARIEGYLVQNGAPAEFAALFARTPEVVELCSALPEGPLSGFERNGAPRQAPNPYPAAQSAEMALVHEGIRTFAQLWAKGACPVPPPEDVRAVIDEMIAAPTLAEASTIGRWQYDPQGADRQRRLSDVVPGEAPAPGRAAVYWPQAARLLRDRAE